MYHLLFSRLNVSALTTTNLLNVSLSVSKAPANHRGRVLPERSRCEPVPELLQYERTLLHGPQHSREASGVIEREADVNHIVDVHAH